MVSLQNENCVNIKSCVTEYIITAWQWSWSDDESREKAVVVLKWLLLSKFLLWCICMYKNGWSKICSISILSYSFLHFSYLLNYWEICYVTKCSIMNTNSFVVSYTCMLNPYSIWYEYMYGNFGIMYHNTLHLLHFSQFPSTKLIPHIPTKKNNNCTWLFSLAVKLSYWCDLWVIY